MKNTTWIFAAAALLSASPVMAGSAGTWIGNGATVFGALGSTITYDRSAEGVKLTAQEMEVFGLSSLPPGSTAKLMLSPEQAAALLAEMLKVGGSRVSNDGSAASVAVVTSDGQSATVLVNATTGQVLLISL